MLDLANEIYQTIRNNKLRTTLTGLSVAWGIFMLIVLLSMARGVSNSFEANVGSHGTPGILLWNGRTSMPYKGYKENRRIRMRESDLKVIEKYVGSDVAATSAYVSIDTAVISTPKDYITGGIEGVYPDMQLREGINMAYGRFINNNDMKQRRKVLVISQSNAELLFDDAAKAVNSQVECMGLAYTIVGVYKTEGNSNNYAPFSTVVYQASDFGKVHNIRVDLADHIATTEQAERVETKVRSALAAEHNFDPDDQSAVWAWNQVIQNYTARGALRMLNVAVWIIGFFTLLSGIVGVSNIMFVSVRERTHEIGIRRAIGAKPHNILTQVIAESIAITGLFGYVGVVFGIAVAEIISHMFADSDFLRNPTVNTSIIIYVTIAMIVAGVISGIFPARNALKVKPVEALRDE